MQKAEDILTGIMLIGSTLIAVGIALVGSFLLLKRSNFIPLTVIFIIILLILYTLRNISIGLSLIFHGRYQDDMTFRENRTG